MEGITRESKGKRAADGGSSEIALIRVQQKLHPPMAGPVDLKLCPGYGLAVEGGSSAIASIWDQQKLHPPMAGTVELNLFPGYGLAADGGSSGIASISDQQKLHPTMAGPIDLKLCPRHGLATIYGRQRELYDTVAVHPYFANRANPVKETYHFYGIFDGHECSLVALCCKERMHKILAEEIEGLLSLQLVSLQLVSPVVDWKDVMLRSFQRMEDELGNAYGYSAICTSCRYFNVGSTAIVAVVGDERFIVANCGDSRAVLCRNGAPILLSNDHKPDRPDEQQRIHAAGGGVMYQLGQTDFGVLAVSRAIGYAHLKPFVTAEPELTVTERSCDDECLILASHELWDLVTNETACYVASMTLRKREPGVSVDDQACSDAAMLLAKLALARKNAMGRKSDHNISVVVIDLRRGRSL